MWDFGLEIRHIGQPEWDRDERRAETTETSDDFDTQLQPLENVFSNRLSKSSEVESFGESRCTLEVSVNGSLSISDSVHE